MRSETLKRFIERHGGYWAGTILFSVLSLPLLAFVVWAHKKLGGES